MLRKSQCPEKQKKSIPGKKNSKCKDPEARRRNSKVATEGETQRAKNRGDKSCRHSSSQNTQGLAGLANCKETILEGRSMNLVCFIFWSSCRLLCGVS